MKAAERDFEIPHTATFAKTFTVTGLIPSEYQWKGQIKRTISSPLVEGEFSFDTTESTVTISAPTLRPGSYVYDIFIEKDGHRSKTFKGKFIVTEVVTNGVN